MIKKCLICKKDFKTFPSRIGKYCSYACNNVKKPGTFKKGHKWVGKLRSNGRHKQSNGYIALYVPSHPFRTVRNAVSEHRLVMEKKIGRYLHKDEVIHHINGIRNDNRIENLMLFSSQSEHVKFEKRRI